MNPLNSNDKLNEIIGQKHKKIATLTKALETKNEMLKALGKGETSAPSRTKTLIFPGGTCEGPSGGKNHALLREGALVSLPQR